VEPWEEDSPVAGGVPDFLSIAEDVALRRPTAHQRRWVQVLFWRLGMPKERAHELLAASNTWAEVWGAIEALRAVCRFCNISDSEPPPPRQVRQRTS